MAGASDREVAIVRASVISGLAVLSVLAAGTGWAAAEETGAAAKPRAADPSQPAERSPPRPQLKPWLATPPPAAPPPSSALRQRQFNYRLELERDTRLLERRLHDGRAGREAFDPLMRGRSDLERLHRQGR